ncbi:ABC transporter permease [Marinitoga litoralis]|uniref:ABC transporter permease n=1 Tax=Marinitoga litoralis TaxID=570855 RepID=UPI001960C841|nr:ABC transporter permease [Marinitoga litoralis]MBM7558400.1 ABC-2 type transport system permease protein [Marinitoga litoralis]
MNKIFWLSKYITKEALRNKAEIFFTLFFPLIFLIIFGFVFFDQYSDTLISVAIYTEDKSVIEDLSDVYKIININNIEDIAKNIKKGNYDVGVIVKDNKVTIYYDEANMNNTSLIQGLELNLKKAILNRKNTIKNFNYIKINEKNVLLTKTKTSYIDYLLTGVIAISLLSNGMFSVITVFGRYKRLNVLKRFILVPINPYTFVIGITLTRILISFASLLILIFSSKIIFNLSIVINWPLYLLLAFTSTIGMMGFGLLFLFLFKKSETAQNAASIFFSLMMFFSGIYFPIEFLPKTFKIISYIFPIKYIVDSLRYISGIELMDINIFLLINGIMLFGGIFLLVYASKKFLLPEK